MSAWKILISDDLDQRGQAILAAAANVDDHAGISAEELNKIIQPYHALIVRGRTRVTAGLLQAAPDLQVIGRAGVGIDNIDLAAAQSQGIAVVNTPTATTTAVAEHTLALMLALLRALPGADQSMKAGQWSKKLFVGSELHGKTLGIIGLGQIGSAVAQRAAAFEMPILAYDPLISAEQARQRGAEVVDLQTLYRAADLITIHTPLTPQTRGMIDGQALSLMKRGVYLICTARGSIVNETALLHALESGQVAGAALDVFAKEPPGLSALVAHPRVLASPHIAAQTKEAQVRAALDIAHEVLAALRGEPLRWRIV